MSPRRRPPAGLDARSQRARLRREESRQGVPLPTGHVPAEIGRGDGAGRERDGRRAHFRGEDRRGRVRHRDGAPRRPARRLHVPAQGSLQPEVQGAQGRVRRRGPDDRRHRHQRDGVVSRHDNGGASLDAVPRRRGHARGGLGHLRRDSLHARFRARRRLGRDGSLPSGRRAIRVPLGDDPQRQRVCRVDRQDAQPPVSSRVHGLSPDAPRALHLPQGRRRHLPVVRPRQQVQAG
mmetsp:Transcript_10524/g.41057  ORF Transcript_10524/g.41057 Transcript_10524/m.41057 type:complete len:235 (+) Transcript_10524:324-1028(+)